MRYFAGLGVLFIGMDMMSSSMPAPGFGNVHGLYQQAFQPAAEFSSARYLPRSSSLLPHRSVFCQALAATGMIPLSSAVYILFGQNIGTCITAVLASIGTKTNAKRTTVIHLLFNIIGTTVFTIICMVTPFVQLMESITAEHPGSADRQYTYGI